MTNSVNYDETTRSLLINKDSKELDQEDKKFLSTVPAIHIRHILFAFKPGVDFHDICIKAEGVLLELSRPNQQKNLFDSLARLLSDCPSAIQGGDLGWITPEICEPELYNELFCQSDWLWGKGVHPRLVRTHKGLHIIEVLARKKKRQILLNSPREQIISPFAGIPHNEDSNSNPHQALTNEKAGDTRHDVSEPILVKSINQHISAASDGLLDRLRNFHSDYFPAHQQRFQDLVAQGQHPKTLFIGCSDSRVVPYLLTGTGPGELFIVRNVGALVPPYDGSHGLHGTMAAIEFAVLSLQVERIIVCGHSHCGAIRTAYHGAPPEAKALSNWLELTREALLPVQPCTEAFHRTEQRSVVLQMERLMDYPMVRREVEARRLTLHGWHYVIETGQVHVFDVSKGDFVPCTEATSSGTGPYAEYSEPS